MYNLIIIISLINYIILVESVSSHSQDTHKSIPHNNNLETIFYFLKTLYLDYTFKQSL